MILGIQVLDLNAVALGIASFIMGALIMFLDFLVHAIFNYSLLRIPHKTTFLTELLLITEWSGGAGIVGFLGGTCKIFNTQAFMISALLIAIAWPIILRNLIEAARKRR